MGTHNKTRSSLTSKNPLVSVIIPTKNSAQFLEKCLISIKKQTYKNIEIIVVDNNSTDNTKKIARKYADKVFNRGPERSAQRNFGAKNSRGEYLLFIDSDMELTSRVVSECVDTVTKNTALKALVIPEKSIGEGFWAECKALERSFYENISWMEAARFFRRSIFNKLKGYDEHFTGSEDYDLPLRLINAYGEAVIDRIHAYIIHCEGKLLLSTTLKKKFYYARELKTYQHRHRIYFKKQSNIFIRYSLYFSRPSILFRKPHIGLGMLFMKTSEFIAGGLSYLLRATKN